MPATAGNESGSDVMDILIAPTIPVLGLLFLLAAERLERRRDAGPAASADNELGTTRDRGALTAREAA